MRERDIKGYSDNSDEACRLADIGEIPRMSQLGKTVIQNERQNKALIQKKGQPINDTLETESIIERSETAGFPIKNAVKYGSNELPDSDSDSDEEIRFKERKGPSFFKRYSLEYSNEFGASMIREKEGSVLDKER